MATIEDRKCNPYWKSFISRIKKRLGFVSQSIFYVVYPPLKDAEDIKLRPELFDPSTWPREEQAHNWFHEAQEVANKVNQTMIIAIVCEVKRHP